MYSPIHKGTENPPAMSISGLLTHRTRAGPVILSLEPTAAKALFLLDLKPELHDDLNGQFNLTVL